MAGFGEGDIANAGGKVAGERRARCDMAQERFPPDTVRIAIGRKRRRFAPPLAVIGADVLHHAEMGDRRRLRNRLHVAAMQPRDRRAFRAIDLQRKQIVAPHPRRP